MEFYVFLLYFCKLFCPCVCTAAEFEIKIHKI